MHVSKNPADLPIETGDGTIEAVSSFTYLGSVLQQNGRLDQELSTRIAKASKTFWSLWQSVFADKAINVKVKCKLYKAVVLSVLLYGSESWALTAAQSRSLEVFHRSCLRRTAGVTRMQCGRTEFPL